MNRKISFLGMCIGMCLFFAVLQSICTSAFCQCIPFGNCLRIPDTQVQRGKTAALPIRIDNVDQVGAFQFDLIFPTGIYPTGEIILSDRTEEFTIAIQEINNNCWRTLGYSPQDQPLAGNNGVAMYINVKITNNVVEGDTLQLTLQNVTLSKNSGEGLPFSYEAGNIIVAQSPDLAVNEIYLDKSKALPGEDLKISFSVSNLGSLPTGAGWTEQFTLTNGIQRKSIGSQTNILSLDGGERVSRIFETVLPTLPLMQGECYVEVKLIPDEECGEPLSAISNNIALSVQPLSLSALLTLTPDVQRLQEGKKTQFRCKATRSGSIGESQTFALFQSTNDLRLSMPERIMIEQGQSSAYFTVNIIDNNELETDSLCTFVISGNNYPEARANVIIIDDELPYLRLTASKSSVVEGDSLILTATTQIPSSKDILLSIYCDYPEKFAFPTTMILPTGNTVVSSKVIALDNKTADNNNDILFEATAEGFDAESCIVELIDNDVPEIALKLDLDTISENQGRNALQGKIRRSTLTDEQVTIMLSDNSRGRISLSAHTFVFKSGETEKTFSIDVNDNDLVDSQDCYEISAAVYLSGCGCQAQRSSIGAATALLVIIDDDGKSLKLEPSSKSWIEGYDKGYVTVSRNTSTDEPLSVDLICDNPQLIKIDSSVTIPTGSRQVKIPVEVLTNSVIDDEVTVLISASSPGFAQGRNWVRIVDFSRPDAVISNLALSDSIVEANGFITVTATVQNDGVSTMPKNTLVQFYSNGMAYPALSYTQKALEPKEECIVTQKVYFPDKLGIYAVYATINENSKFLELDSLNNRSGFYSVKVTSGVRADVQTDKSVYNSGEEVTVTGRFYGENANERTMNIYVTNGIYRQLIDVDTDTEGRFAHTFKPYASQVGKLKIGACYPGEYACENEATIEIYGIEGTLGSNRVEIDLNDTFATKLKLRNPTDLPITGLKLTSTNVPDNCILTLGEINEIEPNGYIEVPITVLGTNPSEANEYHQIGLSLKGNNGISLTKALYYYCHTPNGKLYTNFQPVETTISQGATRDYTVYLQNRGKGETGAITVSLPSIDWISMLTPSQLPSLQSGESCSFILRVKGSESMKLNVTNHASIAVNCTNSDGLLLRFTGKCVADTTGRLIVDVCDEYTYSEPTAPRVSNASIALKDPSNGSVLYSGVSDEQGRFVSEIPAGFYTLCVSADKHENTAYSIEVKPGQENVETANISVKGVTFTYNVIKDEENDTYEAEIKTTFETNVPVPVVIMEGPTSIEGDAMQVGESRIIEFSFTNYGMIQAENVYLQVPAGNDEFVFEPLMSVGPFVLLPNEKRIVPLLLTRISDGQASAQMRAPLRISDDDPDGINYSPDWLPQTNSSYFNNCMAGFAYWYYHNCGEEMKENLSFFKMAVRACNHGSAGAALGSLYSEYNGGGYSIPPILGYLLNGIPPYDDPEGDGDPTFVDLRYRYVYDPSWDSSHDLLVRQVNFCNESLDNCGLTLIDAATSDFDRTGIISAANADCDRFAEDAAKGTEPSAAPVASAARIIAARQVRDVVDNQANSGHGNSRRVCRGLQLANSTRTAYRVLRDCINPIEERNRVLRELRGRQSRAEDDEFVVTPDWMVDQIYALDAVAKMLELQVDLAYEVFGEEVWYALGDEEVLQLLDAIGALNKADINVDNLKHKQPSYISDESFGLFIERLYNTCNFIASDNSCSIERLGRISNDMQNLVRQANDRGYENVMEWYNKSYEEFLKNYRQEEETVCASVGIALSQSVAISREIVRGILEVYNGNEDTAMRDLRMSVKIMDAEGNLANQKFIIQTESAQGFQGEGNDIDGYTLEPDATGRINLMFVPKTDAEMMEPVDYEFGGVVTYIDPYTGLSTSLELYPTILTINPSPVLDMAYFLQRDVIGDDPLTTDVVEASVPAELALLIHNQGHGDALDVNIITHKPEIVRNDKNLAIADFELVYSSLKGKEMSLPIDGEIATAFGTIPAHSLTFAQWWFRSMILGHFIDYDVNLVKDSQYGSEASLIGELSVHELLHSVEGFAENGETIVSFLVNDIVDANDQPDHLYCADGSIHVVSNAANPRIESKAADDYMLLFTAKSPGWVYGKVSDPTNGQGYVSQVICNEDGREIPSRNFWITNVTMRDGKNPLHENILHFVDTVSRSGSASYTLKFAEIEAEKLFIKSINGIYDNSEGIVEAIMVTFSKPVMQSTFGGDNIVLTCDGLTVDGNVEALWVDDSHCQLILGSMASKSGEYAVYISLDQVKDNDGFEANGVTVFRWTMNASDGIDTQWINGKYRLESTLALNYVRVIGDIASINSCTIYSASGQLMSVGLCDLDGIINVSHLPTGLYLLQLNADNGFSVLRFIKR